jgi:hypothetical protein
VPDRFRCFGCGEGGDVIEFVSRRYDLSFMDSDRGAAERSHRNGAVAPLPAQAPAPPANEISSESRPTADTRSTRWLGNTSRPPVAAEFAQSYLARRRGIDLFPCAHLPAARRSWVRRDRVDEPGQSPARQGRQRRRTACDRPRAGHPNAAAWWILPRADHHPRHQQRRPESTASSAAT